MSNADATDDHADLQMDLSVDQHAIRRSALHHMHDDKWNDTVAMIKSKFRVLAQTREDIADIPNGFVELIEFETPQGKMKLERTTSPAVLDKKTVYSKTSARASSIEYTYSKDEVSHRLKAYRFDEGIGEWEEVKAVA